MSWIYNILLVGRALEDDEVVIALQEIILFYRASCLIFFVKVNDAWRKRLFSCVFQREIIKSKGTLSLNNIYVHWIKTVKAFKINTWWGR